MELTHSNLLEVLDYNPASGHFLWRNRGGKFRKNLVGTRAGCPSGPGNYRNIMVFKRFYLEHRLAWFYVHGEWPPEQIDHINRDKSDNRIDNLRLASKLQNMWNSGLRSNNTHGHIGVRFHRRDKLWQAHLTVNGKFHSLGYYKTAEEASLARERAAKDAHGKFHHAATTHCAASIMVNK